jgi:hypothetical protein
VEERFFSDRKYLFAELPHGVFPMGQFLSLFIVEKILPGSKVLSIAASVGQASGVVEEVPGGH